ncbi:hypothetical protein NDR87_21115 [Nocardia sp. CDC159]|uniref:Uncharacterized protein n=1 Tax=Nocardia pulmonis TaxID=2951408 RepID=A0A9X2EC27_9NOCA|nr:MULTISPECIES: hypothetical protein [Nocardia]MCM6776448.1 hypothetical protein [Nocardia pulmonis]MCM6788872.1 hypothetical protein [Nocardia sp. CDC159]
MTTSEPTPADEEQTTTQQDAAAEQEDSRRGEPEMQAMKSGKFDPYTEGA